jgi:hypothetical protein
MRGRIAPLAAALTLFAVLIHSACSSNRAATTGGNPPGEPMPDRAQAGEPVPGRTITKEVPHSSESVSDMKQREAKEPPPPRGDVAIPSHRIRPGDNTVPQTPPADAPATKQFPPGTTPGQTGGNQ